MSRTRTSGTEPSSPGKKRFHKHVDHAIANGGNLLIHYKKLNGRTVKRKIEPRSWRGHTLVAYDHKRKAVRSFRMERVKHMEKAAFWDGFEKQASKSKFWRAAESKDPLKTMPKLASAFAHGAELAGLGTLAVPSIQKLRGKPMSEKAEHGTELAGLGILAAPSLHAAGKSLLSRMAKR